MPLAGMSIRLDVLSGSHDVMTSFQPSLLIVWEDSLLARAVRVGDVLDTDRGAQGEGTPDRTRPPHMLESPPCLVCAHPFFALLISTASQSQPELDRLRCIDRICLHQPHNLSKVLAWSYLRPWFFSLDDEYDNSVINKGRPKV